MDTIKVAKIEDSGIVNNDALWEKLCELFNEGEYSDELELYIDDAEAWASLAEYNKTVHDVLLEYHDGTSDTIKIYEN